MALTSAWRWPKSDMRRRFRRTTAPSLSSKAAQARHDEKTKEIKDKIDLLLE
jgi:hypothetical protein